MRAATVSSPRWTLTLALAGLLLAAAANAQDDATPSEAADDDGAEGAAGVADDQAVGGEGEAPGATGTEEGDDQEVTELTDEQQAKVLLDADDEAAKEGVVVGARGIDPGWKDSRVAERAPNIWGQTGLRRVTSARANKSGYFDVGVHGRFFYSPDFIVPGEQDENIFVGGTGTFGVSIFDVVEVGLAAAFASNQNSEGAPQTLFAAGDFAPSLKIDFTAIPALFGFSTLPVAVGADVRVFVPTQQNAVGPDPFNMAITGNGLFTLDLYEPFDYVPLKLHANVGYTLQTAHYVFSGQQEQLENYYLAGPNAQLFALTTGQWFYDQVHAGIGLEVPLPFVTPYIEGWAQTALLVPPGYGVGGGNYNYLFDTHTILTPGIRFSLRGLVIDFAADIGLTGTGGWFTPDANNLVAGQPLNPLWAVQASISYTFSPFVAETQVEVREKGVPLGQVAGCVVDETSNKPVQDAFVEFTGTAGPRIVVDSQGCFSSPKLDVGDLVVKIKHPEYKDNEIKVAIVADQTATADLSLSPQPRYGKFLGNLTNVDDSPVDGQIVVTDKDGNEEPNPTEEGAFNVKLKPGKYQVLVRSEGYLTQGAEIIIEPNGTNYRNFVLKPIPKKRFSTLQKDKIEISTKIPFEFNKARLLRAAEFILDDVVDLILSNPQIKLIRVEGHTDNIGEKEYNQELSEARADAVMQFLIGKGVPRDRLQAQGFGFSRPIAENDTEEGRAKNRRVEFVIVDQSGGGGGASGGAEDGGEEITPETDG